MAITISAIVAGLIPTSINTKSIDFSGNNNKGTYERVLSEQTLDSFEDEDTDKQVILLGTSDTVPSLTTGTERGQPSNFPTPCSQNRPGRRGPVTGRNPYIIFIGERLRYLKNFIKD